MRILIIDDEMMIKEWLKMTIGSLPFEIEEIETASNGEEAIQKTEGSSFDLIFVDVMMPRMNGLEFLKALKTRGSDAMLVVLSSHDEFEFAKEAIRYDVEEYVLKNECSKEKLSELIQTAAERRQQAEIHDGITEEMMKRIVQGTVPQKAEQLIGQITAAVPGRRYLVSVVSVDEESLPKKLSVEGGLIEEQGYLGCLDDGEFYLHHITLDSEEISLNQLKRHFAEELARKTERKVSVGKFCLTTGEILSECRDGWLGFTDLFYEKGKSCTTGPNQYREFETETVDALCDEVLSDIRSYAKEKTLHDMKRLHDHFRQIRPTDLETVASTYLALLSTFVIYNNKRSRNVTERLDALRSTIRTFDWFEDLAAWVSHTVENDAELIKRGRFSSSVEKALAYIEEHYETIGSVNEIADHVNLSIDYFSRYFKKEVGLPLNSYLIDYRLEKASIILLSSNLSVTEVAKKVGIENSSYFSKCFKKKFHTQPVRFRIQTKEQ